MGMDGKYHWLSVQIIYVENPFNDDVLAIELVKVLDSQRAEQARQAVSYTHLQSVSLLSGIKTGVVHGERKGGAAKSVRGNSLPGDHRQLPGLPADRRSIL